MDGMDRPTQFRLPLGVRPHSGEEVTLPVGTRGRAMAVVGEEGCGKTVIATKLADRLAEAAVPGSA